MKYYIETTIETDFDSAVEKVKEELKKEGFGVLTEIDIHNTLKAKLDVDFRPYKILGACNPPNAFEALKAEEHIGLMLPCNVVVQESSEPDKIKVSAIDPVASMMAVDNSAIEPIAHLIKDKLARAIEQL
ncbi:Uncharacterized conserved protein, DUF302 family [Draconibacterium orientale]|uniref:Uncharacterized conserved protein, DUF302 family n=1 Tax=Draconibacterium orientale TaxID=1168034 RepID=X5DJ57_9BACT|nr:DUF302 domain-containing protein [Draconibacterium orientale]AHW61154.1 hypothetical protein FH5T_20155 [Draconibacterium orientale]SET34907.1 Uncharacterized conserved protein, DUF302 family [Draconibacterium orientale]